MSLLIDIGNTRIKFGYADADGLVLDQYRIALAHNELANLLPWLQQHHLKPKMALGICVASADIKQQVEHLLFSICCNSYWLDSTSSNPLLINLYDQPERLGSDRWLGLIGVLAKQKPPIDQAVIHVSFGTATTIDTALPATTQQPARFIGGLILPGPQLMYDSLALNTAQLGNGRGTIDAFPANTRAAISTGIASAQAGAIWRQWHMTYAQTQCPPLLVCSGGGWPLVQAEVISAYADLLKRLQLSQGFVIEQPTPVLDGLAYMITQTKLS